MIDKRSFDSAVSAAGAIAETGQVVMAVPGTVIGEMVRLSAPLDPQNLTIDSGEMVQAETAGTLDNPSLHDRELDAFIKDISKAVTSHVSYAKNVVKPMVQEFVDELIKYRETTKPAEAASSFEITTLRMPALLKDESFLDTLTYYKDKSVLTPDVPFSLQTKTRDELNELILIGHERSDKLIVEWLSQLPENFLLSVWNSMFTRNSGDTTGASEWKLLNHENIMTLNAFAKADIGLAILLLARKISSQVQDSDMSLAVYKNISTQHVDYAGALLMDALKKLDLLIKAKTLVIEHFAAQHKLSVNGEIYGQWLEQGGSPEVLMGMSISGASVTSQAMIDEKHEDYLRQWNSYVTFFRTREFNNSFAYAKTFIESLYMRMSGQRHESETEVLTANSQHVENERKAVLAALDSLKNTDLDDPYVLGLLFIAKIRFPYTSAYQILSDIHEAGKVNPNVDVREAALLAVINYVSDYVSSQLTLVSK